MQTTVTIIGDPVQPAPDVREGDLNSLQDLVRNQHPAGIVLQDSDAARHLAARLAVRLDATLVTSCTDLALRDSHWTATTMMYAGRIQADWKLQPDRPWIATILSAETIDTINARPDAARFTLDFDPLPGINAAPVETQQGTRALGSTDTVVAGGRGIESAEDFAMIEELADLLNASVGASRPAVDDGLQPHASQVGLTGRTVAPDLYIAIGIDGSIQHLAGMRGSKKIIAINNKSSAPIFNIATIGCIADYKQLLPPLIEELKKRTK